MQSGRAKLSTDHLTTYFHCNRLRHSLEWLWLELSLLTKRCFPVFCLAYIYYIGSMRLFLVVILMSSFSFLDAQSKQDYYWPFGVRTRTFEFDFNNQPFNSKPPSSGSAQVSNCHSVSYFVKYRNRELGLHSQVAKLGFSSVSNGKALKLLNSPVLLSKS